MKREEKPRKIYVRKDVPHVCFQGSLWAPGKQGLDGTRFDVTKPIEAITLMDQPTDIRGTKTRTVQVEQGLRKKKPSIEWWYEWVQDEPSLPRDASLEVAIDDHPPVRRRASKRPIQKPPEPGQRVPRPRGGTTGDLEQEGVRATVEACRVLGLRWSEADEIALRNAIRKKTRR